MSANAQRRGRARARGRSRPGCAVRARQVLRAVPGAVPGGEQAAAEAMGIGAAGPCVGAP